MDNFDECLGSNFSDHKGSTFSASLSLKSKLLKKKLRSTSIPSESEEQHDREEIKSTSTKTSNIGKDVIAPYQKRKAFRSLQQAFIDLASFVEQIASVQMKINKLPLGLNVNRCI